MGDLGFWRLAEAHPERVAIIDPDGGEHTAGEMLARANRTAHGLRALGVGPGDTVAVVMPNGLEMMDVYLAALQIGVYITPINHHLVGPEIAYILGDSEAKVFITHERFTEAATAAASELDFPAERRFAVGTVEGFRPYAELTDGQPDTAPPDRTTGQAMHYTSGTTGKPKGVKRAIPVIGPDDMGELMTMLPGMFGIQAHDDNVHICGSPLYHTAVLMYTGCSLHMGHTVVLMDKWTPEGMLQLIERHKVTHSHMVPTQFHRLLALPDEVRATYDVSSLRHMIHAAAPCPPDVKRRMIEWWGDAIDEYYAATEGGGTLISAKEWMDKPGSVGKPWPSSEIRILDDAGEMVPTGQIGTVYMLLGSAAFEYKGDKAKTDANRHGDFFTVGDVGYLDEDGYLFLCDRKSDMIISGGVNIYPAEIEGELLAHPKVGDAAVFGIPHADWGEEIKAVIEPAAGVEASDELAAEILAHAAARMAKFKLPRSIDFTNDMPRDPNGKLYKRKLRDPYWEDKERAI
jgi:long-chain acyl-CoA synthetase